VTHLQAGDEVTGTKRAGPHGCAPLPCAAPGRTFRHRV